MGHRRKKAGPMRIIVPIIIIIVLACLAVGVIIIKKMKENSVPTSSAVSEQSTVYRIFSTAFR